MSRNQHASRVCRLEWGRHGARIAAERGDLLVIVDVLSFSTCAVAAAINGARIYPCIDESEARQAASEHGGEIAVRREDVPAAGRFSLSPATMLGAAPFDRILLPSPNGAACCRFASSCPALLVGCLLNASAAARAAMVAAARHGAGITVLACGERWSPPTEDGSLRFALEDYLGAGAVLAALDLPLAPDAAVCRSAFEAAKPSLIQLISECPSGIELRDRGWPQDVDHAARLDVTEVVPTLIDGWLREPAQRVR